MRTALLGLVGVGVLVVAACGDDPAGTAGPDRPGGPKDPSGDGGTRAEGGTNPGDDDDDVIGNPDLPPPQPKVGTVELTLTADKAAANDATVSFGLPFSQGTFTNEKQLTVFDEDDKPVAIATKTLAKWPGDGSIRSVLVAFKTTLAKNAVKKWKVEYGKDPQGGDAGALDANPDGPVMATLTADHYAASHVSGIILPRAKNKKFEAYETTLDDGDAEINLGDYTQLVCAGTSNHRTYYDGPHARYQRGLRSGVAAQLRAAHDEAKWYRANEMIYIDAAKTIAITKCEAVESGQPTWTPKSKPLDWSTLRMMSGQGSLDDYLVTGDPAARQALVGLGEAYRQNLPLLEQGTLEITERNLGWPIMGLASYYAVDQRAEVKEAVEKLVNRAYAWQARGTSGALEHDIERPDPEECGNGPNGASPFMTSLVVDGIMDWWLLSGDPKVKPFMEKLAGWYQKDALLANGTAFKYLWNCTTDDYEDHELSSPELNVLIAHVFGAAYAVTKDKKWITFGDPLAEAGVDAMFVGLPKQWNQASRSFGKYLGYRALSGAEL